MEKIYSVSKTLTDADQWTSSIIPAFMSSDGRMNISVIYGTGATSTVRLQRTFDSGTSWGTVKAYTTSEENQVIDTDSASVYRIGIATGEFGTAGKVVSVRLSRG